MAEGQADREVIFRLSAEADPKGVAAIKEFGDEFAKAHDKMTRGARAAAVVRADHFIAEEMRASRVSLKGWQDFYNKLRQMAKRGPVASMPAPTGSPPSTGRPEPKRGPDPVAAEEKRRQREEAAAERAQQRKAASEEKARQRREAAEERARAKRLAAEKRAQDKELKEWRKAQLKRENEEKEAAERIAKSREKAEKAYQRTGEKLARAYEQAQAKEARALGDVENAQRRVTDSFHMGAEGAVKMARGVAMIGLLGEKNLEKLLRGLIKIQAAFDLVRGGLQLWRALSDGVKAFAAVTTASQAAEIAARKANAAMINAETRAIGRKAAANALASGSGGGWRLTPGGAVPVGAKAGGGAISLVRSVDIVTDPATTTSLFESATMPPNPDAINSKRERAQQAEREQAEKEEREWRRATTPNPGASLMLGFQTQLEKILVVEPDAPDHEVKLQQVAELTQTYLDLFAKLPEQPELKDTPESIAWPTRGDFAREYAGVPRHAAELAESGTERSRVQGYFTESTAGFCESYITGHKSDKPTRNPDEIATRYLS